MAILTAEQVTAVQSMKTAVEAATVLNTAAFDQGLRISYQTAQGEDGKFAITRFDVYVRVDPAEYA